MPCQVAILSSYEQDSVINLAVVDRLLAHQVNFTGFLDNHLPEVFSDALLEGKLLLIDRASLLKLTPGERRKVETFAREHVVQCFDYVRDPGDRAQREITEPAASLRRGDRAKGEQCEVELHPGSRAPER